MTGKGQTGWEWLGMAGNGWKWLEVFGKAGMAGNGTECKKCWNKKMLEC